MNSHNNSRKNSTPVFKSTRLLDQLREQIRYLHYSLRTEEAYVYWVKKFIYFHHKRHPRDMGQAQVEALLSHMAVERKVSVSTHRQALSALLFLYQKVLGIELPWMDELARPVQRATEFLMQLRHLARIFHHERRFAHHLPLKIVSFVQIQCVHGKNGSVPVASARFCQLARILPRQH